MKKRRQQLDLGLGGDKHKPTGPERTLEVNCSNCGLCGGDDYKRGDFKGATIRLLAQVSARRRE